MELHLDHRQSKMKYAQYYVHILLRVDWKTCKSYLTASFKAQKCDIFQRLDTEVDAEKEQVYISGKF